MKRCGAIRLGGRGGFHSDIHLELLCNEQVLHETPDTAPLCWLLWLLYKLFLLFSHIISFLVKIDSTPRHFKKSPNTHSANLCNRAIPRTSEQCPHTLIPDSRRDIHTGTIPGLLLSLRKKSGAVGNDARTSLIYPGTTTLLIGISVVFIIRLHLAWFISPTFPIPFS